MKNKKYISRIVVATFAVVIALLALYTLPRVAGDATPGKAPVNAAAITRTVSEWTINDDQAAPPGDVHVTPVYDDEGNIIQFIKEFNNILISDKQYLLCAPGDSQLMWYKASDKKAFTSANKAAQIYFDSINLRHTISTGDKALKRIDPNETVYMTAIQDPADGVAKEIYTLRVRKATSWKQRLNPFGNQAKYVDAYYDMNGRIIPNSWFIDHEKTAWGAHLLKVALPAAILLGPAALLGVAAGVGSYIYGIFKGFKPVDNISVREIGTYQMVTTFIDEMSTTIYWPYIPGLHTENGKQVYVDPSNGQLCTKMYKPLFDRVTGNPVVFKDGKIMTIPDEKECEILDGVALNVITEQYLLDLGKDVYVHYIMYKGKEYMALALYGGLDARGIAKWLKPNGEDGKDFYGEGAYPGDVPGAVDPSKPEIVNGGAGGFWDAIKNFFKKIAGIFTPGNGILGVIGGVFNLIILACVVALFVALGCFVVKRIRDCKGSTK